MKMDLQLENIADMFVSLLKLLAQNLLNFEFW